MLRRQELDQERKQPADQELRWCAGQTRELSGDGVDDVFSGNASVLSWRLE
jgi:hypothetical protein